MQFNRGGRLSQDESQARLSPDAIGPSHQSRRELFTYLVQAGVQFATGCTVLQAASARRETIAVHGSFGEPPTLSAESIRILPTCARAAEAADTVLTYVYGVQGELLHTQETGSV